MESLEKPSSELYISILPYISKFVKIDGVLQYFCDKQSFGDYRSWRRCVNPIDDGFPVRMDTWSQHPAGSMYYDLYSSCSGFMFRVSGTNSHYKYRIHGYDCGTLYEMGISHIFWDERTINSCVAWRLSKFSALEQKLSELMIHRVHSS